MRSHIGLRFSIGLCLVFCLALVESSRVASASLTLLAGPSLGTHVGNLVTNGSFEAGAPAPGGANYVYWATGTTSTPVAVPAGWTSQGAAANYAVWGSDTVTSPYATESSATLPDGSAGLYFGNGTGVASSLQPTFNTNGTVSFAGTPTFTPKPTYPIPVSIAQTVNTNLAPAASYLLSFWVSGEDTGLAPTTPFNGDGIFGLQMTNVLATNPIQYLTVPSGLTGLGQSIRYEYSFTPLNPSLPVKIQFLNWGHFNFAPFGGPSQTTELVLDDVIVNAIPEPGSLALVAIAAMCLTGVRSRKRSILPDREVS